MQCVGEEEKSRKLRVGAGENGCTRVDASSADSCTIFASAHREMHSRRSKTKREVGGEEEQEET